MWYVSSVIEWCFLNFADQINLCDVIRKLFNLSGKYVRIVLLNALELEWHLSTTSVLNVSCKRTLYDYNRCRPISIPYTLLKKKMKKIKDGYRTNGPFPY